MNDENLRSFGDLSTSELREMQAKGGRNSGATRRRKKAMKDWAKLFLDNPAAPADMRKLEAVGADEGASNAGVIVAALIQNAKRGDVQSIKELRSIIGDDERIKIERERLRMEKKRMNSTDGKALEKLDEVLAKIGGDG